MSSFLSQFLQVSVGDPASLSQRKDIMYAWVPMPAPVLPLLKDSGRGRERSSPRLPRDHILDRSRTEPIISYNMTISTSRHVSWMSCISLETWIRSVAFAGTGVSAFGRIYHLFPTNHLWNKSMLSFPLKWKTNCPRAIITTSGPLWSSFNFILLFWSNY